MTFDYDDQIIISRRQGNSESPYVHIDESLVIDPHGKVILTEMPSKFNGVSVSGDNKTWFEIKKGVPKANEYLVDYKGGKAVTFNISNAGKQLAFSYEGMGQHFIPSSMVYTEQENGTVVETLKGLVDKSKADLATDRQSVQDKLQEATDKIDETEVARQTVIQTNTDVNAEEEIRVSSENTRISTENQRGLDETERKNSESTRKVNELERINAENIRISNESSRVTAENEREENESQRILDEADREATEDVRISNENTRISSENSRVSAEAVRESQETARQQFAATALTDLNTLTNNTKFIEPYNTTTTYKPNNIVSLNGNSYICKKTSTNNTPPDPLIATGNEFWGLLSRKGADSNGNVVVHKDKFIATEGQTIFTLSYPYDQFQNRTTVTVGGVPQRTPDNYEEANSNTIILNDPVSAGTVVEVKYFSEALPLASDIQTVVDNHTDEINKFNNQSIYTEDFIAVEGQTVFTLQTIYDQLQDKVEVYVDGVPQDSGDNFTESANNQITLSEGVPLGTEVKVRYFGKRLPIGTDVEVALNTHAETLGNHTTELNSHASDITSLTSQLAETIQQIKNIVTVDVKSFGAKGDGVTDDSVAIQNAIATLPKTGGKLLFPPGVYLHGDGVTTGYSYTPNPSYPNRPLEDAEHPVDIGRDIRFIFKDYDNLTISGYGATIQSHDNNGECRNNSILTFENCTNLRIEGLKIDGRSQFREPVLGDYNTGKGYADRSNIYIKFGENITLQDVESNYSMMDGVFLFGNETTSLSNVRVVNCNCYYNYRQGMTISSVNDCVVDGGNYSFTGVLRGTLPKAGIDVEADAHESYNVAIKNAKFDSNAVSGLALSFRGSNITVEQCTFVNKGVTTVRDDSCVNNVVKGNVFINCGLGFSQYGVKYYDNLFKFDTEGLSTNYHFDFGVNTDKVDGKLDVFERNTILVDLEDVPLGSTGALGCFKLTGTRVMSFKNNIIKNSYVNQSGLAYAIWLSGVGLNLENNQMIFDYAGTNISSSNQRTNIVSPVYKDNNVTGFTRDSTDTKYSNQYGASSDFKFSKSFGIANQVNKLHKINANYSGTLKVSANTGDFELYELKYNSSAGTLTVNMTQQNGTSAFCNVYKSATYLYIEPLLSSLVVEIDFSLPSATSRRSPLDVTLDLDTVTDKATLLLLAKPLLSKSVTSKEAITQTPPYKGFTTFDESRNKNITWTGTGWVDQMGTVV
ncbi:hypothetical protein BAOM_3137 [Peribacillus asahii]|uniref:Rhamnogalacturonase A/B/Epimerase-like pectate lyase domain-containing protein n=1 Tax=Peribacillus asahii TaxID=228899 RepID=A0A3Q9RPA4_9BACI|nr:glycosyl hydrolase family 28-related protein [Peribacillus asahii]AZV43746.1 hypothetical protein BAOM_3137 [Peribacillus asahii]